MSMKAEKKRKKVKFLKKIFVLMLLITSIICSTPIVVQAKGILHYSNCINAQKCINLGNKKILNQEIGTKGIIGDAPEEYWNGKLRPEYYYGKKEKPLSISFNLPDGTVKSEYIYISELSSDRVHIIKKKELTPNPKWSVVVDSECLGVISFTVEKNKYLVDFAEEKEKEEKKKEQEERAKVVAAEEITLATMDRSEGSEFWTHKWDCEWRQNDYNNGYGDGIGKFYDKYLSKVTNITLTTEDFFYRPICKLSEIKYRSDKSKFHINKQTLMYTAFYGDSLEINQVGKNDAWYVEFSNGYYGIMSLNEVAGDKRTSKFLLDRYTYTGANLMTEKGGGDFVYYLTEDNPVTVVKVEDGYCQVNYKGKTGWIEESNLRKGSPQYVYAKKYIARPGYVNIAVGTKMKILKHSENYNEFTVQHPIFKWATFTLGADKVTYGAPYLRYTKNNLALYTSTSPSTKKATVVKGTKLSVLSTGGTYTKIKTSDGKIGYVSSESLSTTPVAKQLKKYYGNYYLVWPQGLNLETGPDYGLSSAGAGTGDSYYPRFTALRRVDNWYYSNYNPKYAKKSKTYNKGPFTYSYIKVQGPDGRIGYVDVDSSVKRTLAQAKQAAKYYHLTNVEKQAFNYVNQLRAKAGIPKLKWNQQAYEEQNLVWSRYTERFGDLDGTHSFELSGDMNLGEVQLELRGIRGPRNATKYGEVMINNTDNDSAKEMVDQLCGKYDPEGNDNQHKAVIYDDFYESACVTAIKQGNNVSFIIYFESDKDWGNGSK